MLTRPVSQATVHGAAPAARGAAQRLRGVVEPAFLVVDARQVERALGPAQPLDLGERRLGLAQLALLAAGVAFEQQADAVVVPALPQRLRRCGRSLPVPCNGSSAVARRSW